jgi:hypothetical protein
MRLLLGAVFIPMILLCGCGAINIGKWKGIEKTAADEKYYLVKEAFLTPGTAYGPKESFDHALNDVVNLCFKPNNEKNHYVAESRWFDPSGQEYRTIRQTYDLREENKKDQERPKGGSTRTHTLTTKELVDHKPGMWKVALYMDDQLVRRLNFFIR